MAIPMQLEIIGAIPVDFVTDDGKAMKYIKVFALVDAKNGHGSVSQVFRYGTPDKLSEFEHMEFGYSYPANCSGTFEGNGSKSEFVLETIKFDGKPKPMALTPNASVKP